jgi:hypothetical protein
VVRGTPVHGKDAVVAVGDVGGAEPDGRRAWRRSNWIQATFILGFLAVVAWLDWALNESLTYVGVLGIGIAGGLAVGAVLRARRRRFNRS